MLVMLMVSTHYPSGVTADDRGPVYYQQQVLASVPRTEFGTGYWPAAASVGGPILEGGASRAQSGLRSSWSELARLALLRQYYGGGQRG
jgi:hypothetical protein